MVKIHKTSSADLTYSKNNSIKEQKSDNKKSSVSKTALILTGLSAAAILGAVLIKRQNPKKLLDGTKINPNNAQKNALENIKNEVESLVPTVKKAEQKSGNEQIAENIKDKVLTGLNEEQNGTVNFVLVQRPEIKPIFAPEIKCLPAPKPLLMLPETSSASKDPIGVYISRFLSQDEDSMKKESYKVLKNGIKVKETLISKGIGGDCVISEYDKPVNGVKSIITHRFVNGDISSVEVFDSNKKLIKDIAYSRSYMQDVDGSLMQVRIRDAKKGNSLINYNYSRKTGHLNNVEIVNDEGVRKVPVTKKSRIKEGFIKKAKSLPKVVKNFLQNAISQDKSIY